MKAKFILEERYLLSERLVLTEADAILAYDQFQDKCKNILKFTKEQLTRIENDTDNTEDLDNVVSKILSETNQLVLDTENVNDANIIRGHIDRYFDKIDNFLLIVDPNYTADDSTKLRQLVNGLKAKTKDTDNSKKAISILRASINDLHTLFDNFTNDLTTASQAGDNTTFDKVDQEIILNNIYEDILKLSKYTDENYKSVPFQKLLSNSVEDLANVATSATLFEFIKLSKTLHDGSFGKTIRDDTTVTLNQSEIDQKRADRLDWGKQYQQAGDKDKFWDDYFRTVWGSDAEKVKALGEAFKQECLVLGFTRTSNPFIGFVEDYVVKKNFPVSKSQYNAIHDTVANNGAISTTDLIKPILPLKGGNMILWYKDLYVKASSYENIKEYLKILGQLRLLDYSKLNAVNTADMEPTVGKAYSNLLSHFGGAGGNMAAVIYNIFVEEIKTNKLLNTAGTGTPCPENPAKFGIRPLADINELFRVLNIEASAKRTWSAESTSKLVATIKENALFSSDSATWAKKFLTLIATIYATADQIATLKKEPWWTMPDTPRDHGETIKIKQELEKLGTGINMSQFTKIRKDFEDEGWLD